jgi:ubiquinone/menaquinone biosynthesis C-methylase UbiE
MAGIEALCLHSDGVLYPSAATAGQPELAIGAVPDPEGRSMREVWLRSRITNELRQASVVNMPSAANDPLRFITGGGDVEHSWFWSGSFLGEDPYAKLIGELAKDLMADLGREGRAKMNKRAGHGAPVIFHAMGDGALLCGDEVPGAVRTVHSNCVLAFDVDRPRALVREFYGAAAEKPQADLCCPVRPAEEDLRHIPKDVVDRFYGCGSPVADAALRFGEKHLDLGSGAGIDVFIAARHVGPMGKAIGVDMTDAMLEVANANKPVVAKNLGYDVVTFHKGLLEKVPVGDREVDCVTSNCVVNLSPDKRAVLGEVWRVLKDHWRLVLADIVADREVPPALRVNPQLWGECISGALTQDELLHELERAGFFGIEILKRAFWREVEGVTFTSLTVRAWKHEAPAEPVRRGHVARYDGPFATVTDERGHLYRRNEPVEVSEDQAVMLLREPYAGSFTVEGPPLPGQVSAKKKPAGQPGCC